MAQFPLVDQPIRLLRRGSSEFALSNHVARRLASALIGLIAASAIVLFLFSPRDRVLPANFDTRPSPNRGNTSTVIERPNRTLSSAKTRIQARLFPMRGSPQIFRKPTAKATILCQLLADAGFETTVWQRTLVDDDEWECTSTLIPVTLRPSNEAPQSSLFIAFRGSREGKITSLRLKMNFLNSWQDNLVLDVALRFFAVLRDFAGLSPPEDVVDAIAQRKPLLLKTYSASYRLGPEISDPRRLNLIVAYHDFPRYNELVKGELGQAEKLVSEGHFRFEWWCGSGSQILFPLQGMPWDNRHYRVMKPIEFPTGASARTTILNSTPIGLPPRAKSLREQGGVPQRDRTHAREYSCTIGRRIAGAEDSIRSRFPTSVPVDRA